MQTLKQEFLEVLEQVKDHPYTWPFLKPVDPKEVPDYYDIIKDPIGIRSVAILTLNQILRRLRNEFTKAIITSPEIFSTQISNEYARIAEFTIERTPNITSVLT